MALKAGSINEKSEQSMVNEMAMVFENEWGNAMGSELPVPEINNQVRLMFLAVAKGLVKHMADIPSSFKVKAGEYAGEITQIETI